MHQTKLIAAAVAFVVAGVLSAPADASTTVSHSAASAGGYVDVVSSFTADADYEAWDTLRAALRQNFDNVCGDTFCEGDYSNIEALDFQCSVQPSTGRIGSCVWTFAGSYSDIDPATGRIATTGRLWKCRTPLVRGTTYAQLIAALRGNNPLETPLPNTTTTIYDGLVDCL